jgi:hypothetical protein
LGDWDQVTLSEEVQNEDRLLETLGDQRVTWDGRGDRLVT